MEEFSNKTAEGDDSNIDPLALQGTKKADKNKNTLKKKKSAAQRKNNRKNNSNGLLGNLKDMLFTTLEKHREMFFTVHLHSAHRAANLNATKDPDPLMPCDLMDSRDGLLTMAREKHWEFSSLRRTKYSTMALLVQLHNIP